MYYRLSCIISTGEIRGYQWRELDLATFVAVATGTRPEGDADAQERNSPAVDPDYDGSTVYYGHVWYDGWQTDLTIAEAETLYPLAGRSTPGA